MFLFPYSFRLLITLSPHLLNFSHPSPCLPISASPFLAITASMNPLVFEPDATPSGP